MLLHVSACISIEVEDVIFLPSNISHSLRQKAPHFCDIFTKDRQNIKILPKVSIRIITFPNYINQHLHSLSLFQENCYTKGKNN